jgi:hypothetical protein
LGRQTEEELDRLDAGELGDAWPALRVLVPLVDLAQRVQVEPLDREACIELDARLAEREAGVRGRPRRLLIGRAFGTRGRAGAILGQPERALPLLRDALQHHRKTPELAQEAARSGIYLAQALRMAGSLGQAEEALQESARDLAANDVATVRQATTAWREYECARLGVVLGLRDAGLREEHARSTCSETSTPRPTCCARSTP